MRVALTVKANTKYGHPIKFPIDDANEGNLTWHGVCDVTEDEVMNARRGKKSEPVVDPALSMVVALVEKYREGWIGTATQFLVEASALVDCSLASSSVTIGKRLPGINHKLAKRGISWNVLKSKYHFSKRPQRTLER